MHLIKILSLTLICITLSACANKPMTQEETIMSMLASSKHETKWKELRTAGKHQELVQTMYKVTSPQEALAALNWLRKVTVLENETHYIYPYLYSIMLHKTGYIDGSDGNISTALAMRTHAVLLHKGDSLRCDDNGVGTRESMSIMQATKPIYERGKKLSKKEKSETKEFIKMLQERASKRAPRKEACQTGAKYMAKALESGHAIMKKKKTGTGTVVTINPSDDIPVEFVSDEEWFKRLAEITSDETLDKLLN